MARGIAADHLHRVARIQAADRDPALQEGRLNLLQVGRDEADIALLFEPLEKPRGLPQQDGIALVGVVAQEHQPAGQHHAVVVQDVDPAFQGRGRGEEIGPAGDGMADQLFVVEQPARAREVGYGVFILPGAGQVAELRQDLRALGHAVLGEPFQAAGIDKQAGGAPGRHDDHVVVLRQALQLADHVVFRVEFLVIDVASVFLGKGAERRRAPWPWARPRARSRRCRCTRSS